MKTEQLNQFLTLPDGTVVEAMEKIDINGKGIIFVVNQNRKLLGVLTDGDIRRWLIKTGDLNVSVSRIMNQNPRAVYRKDIGTARECLIKYSINALPVLSAKGIVSDLIFREDCEIKIGEQKSSLPDIPVVIMAGGKGTRLYPYTKVLPKPLIPIGDIPIMERIINRFTDAGAKNFYATVNYKKNMIKSYFMDLMMDYKIQYVEEEKPLGTAGSLKLLPERIDAPFFVTNCDILIQADYADIYRYHTESQNVLTIVTALKNIVVPYGVIHSEENGAVMSMEEKPKLSYFVNTGMYVLNPELIDLIPQNTFFHMTDLVDLLIAQGKTVGMYPVSEDSFLDMGEFEEMDRMEKRLNLKSE